MKCVLISGAASGIGKATKKYFLDNGYFVIAIDINKIDDENKNVINLRCDITNIYDILAVNKYLIDNNIKLDAIINIAGIHKIASFIESDYNAFKQVINVNLLGTINVNKTLYPSLKSDGRIIIVTSEVASLDPLPFNGLYNVSKTALDSYAQSLRQELNLLNQKVITIRPGAINTPLSDNSLVDIDNLSNETKLYNKQAKKFLSISKKFMGTPLSPMKLAKKIYKVTNKKHPKYIYNVHRNFGLILLSILPKRLQCFIIKLLLK